MTRKRLLVAGAVLAAAALAIGLGSVLLARRAPRYNIIIITLDTTRADRIGCYGHASAETPTLDALAARGRRYANAFTHVPLTLPSHATIMTGVLPPEHGLRDNGRAKLGPGLPTLAELFAARGYRTAAFLASFVLDKRFGVDRGFEVYDDRMAPPDTADDLFGMENPANVVADRALEWLGQQGDRPFFCWVHFFDPHEPYRAPEPYRSRHRDAYDGEIAFMDAQIKRIVDYLDQRDLRDNTLIVVAGDHGEAFGEHGEHEHGALVYDTTMRVPLIVVPPGGADGPAVVHEVAGLADIAPTVLSVAGLQRPEQMSGRDLLGRRGDEAGCYGESHFLLNGYGWAPLYSLTTRRWKYIDCPVPELYNLLADHSEMKNVYAAEVQAVARLKARLDARRKAMKTAHAVSVELDTRALDALKQLGYLGGTSHATRPVAPGRRKDPKAMIHVHNACSKAAAFIQAGRHKEVIELLAPLVARTPDSPVLHKRLIDSYAALGRPNDAIRHLEGYLAHDPNDRAMIEQLGRLLLKQDKAAEATKVLVHGLRLPRGLLEPATESGASKTEIEMRLFLGTALCRQGRLEQAAQQYRLVLKAAPTHALANVSLADILNLRGDYAGSLPHYDAALKHAAADPSVNEYGIRTNLGVALAKLGRLDDAAKQFERALRRRPKGAEARQELGLLLCRRKRYDEAFKTWRDGLRLVPDEPLLARTMAWWLATCPDAAQRDGARAVRWAGRLNERTGGKDARILDTLAAAYAEAGRFGEAVATARKAQAAARAADQAALAAEVEQRLALYAAAKPYRQTQ